MYEESGSEVAVSKKYDHNKNRPSDDAAAPSSSTAPNLNDAENGDGHVNGNGAAATAEKPAEGEEQPQTSLLLAIVLLVVVTVLVAVTAEFLVDSVDGLTENGGISKEFVGIILLAIVGNAAGMYPLCSQYEMVLITPLQNTLRPSRYRSRTS